MNTRSDFWSRRKAAVEAEQQAEREAEEAALRADQEAQLEEKTDEELLAELDLPEPEAMDSTEQVQTLLKSAVPQRLKTRALRRLWRLNPVLANVDGLVDYGEDFTDAANVIENLQTTYQVGKGMLKALNWESPKPADMEADDAAPGAGEDGAGDDAALLAGAETATPDDGHALTSETQPQATAAQPDTDAATDAAPVAAQPSHDTPAQPSHDTSAQPSHDTPAPDFEEAAMPAAPRRMRFHFDTAT